MCICFVICPSVSRCSSHVFHRCCCYSSGFAGIQYIWLISTSVAEYFLCEVGNKASKQPTIILSFYDTITRNMSWSSWRKNKSRCNSPFTRGVQEIYYLAGLREMYKKYFISPFTRYVQEIRYLLSTTDVQEIRYLSSTTDVQEIWYLAVYERCTKIHYLAVLRDVCKKCVTPLPMTEVQKKTISRRLREMYKK